MSIQRGRTRQRDPRNRGARGAAPKPTSGLKPRHHKLIVSGSLAALAVLAFFVVSKGSTELPDEILGVWTTDAARYEDRGFVLGEETLTLLLGEHGSRVHPIETISAESARNRDLYTIYYRDGSGTGRFAFYYERAPVPMIVLENQPDMEWLREGEANDDG